MRQIQHHRRRALGARRVARLRAARRVDAGRDLQRLDDPQARQPGERRADLRQLRRPRGRPVGPVRRDRREACAYARRHVELLHQQLAGAPPRHPGHLPRHRPRPARVRDHRAGDDRADHRGEARRAARVPRGSRGRVEVQGAPPRDREPAARHAREPDARRGHHPRTRGEPRSSRRRPSSRRSTRSSSPKARRSSACCGCCARTRPRPSSRSSSARSSRRRSTSKRRPPSCAKSNRSSRRCASRTMPRATRCRARRARSTRRMPK